MKKVKIILEQNDSKTINNFAVIRGKEDRGQTIIEIGSPIFLRYWVLLLLDIVSDNKDISTFKSITYNNNYKYTPNQAAMDFYLLAQ